MSNQKNCYPHVHFAPRFGWLNDPNGMVYHDGVYELYFQHNPNGIEWADMTWGHARSTDLLHWEELEPVLYPDETGMMFSGSAVVNEFGLMGLPKDALLYYYTAAGFRESPAFTAHFTIRLAHSTDGGNTLVKDNVEVLEPRGGDNRDPKVFWHEASKAYILVLWLKEDIFGIFRSENARDFVLSSEVRLEGGFECPDLFCLPVVEKDGTPTGESKWVFWAADASYYVGSFDGCTFTQEQRRMHACGQPMRQLPYAAQTFSNYPGGKTVSVAWLRTDSIAEQTTGAMSLPRELSLVKTPMGYILRQALPAEMPEAVPAGRLESGACLAVPDKCLKMSAVTGKDFCLTLTAEDGSSIVIGCDPQHGGIRITVGDVTTFVRVGRDAKGFEMIYDRGIIEIGDKDCLRLDILDLPSFRTKPLVSASLKGEGAGVEIAALG